MDYYQLNSETMDYDDTATRSAFWRILDRAKKQTGFDAARDRVLIQVFPRKSGGCEMYVTKAAPNKQEERNPIKNDPSPARFPGTCNRRGASKKYNAGYGTNNEYNRYSKTSTAQRTALLVQCTYAFDDPESLLLCCALLCGTYHGKSEAWYEPLSDGGERYYLILWENTNERDTWRVPLYVFPNLPDAVIRCACPTFGSMPIASLRAMQWKNWRPCTDAFGKGCSMISIKLVCTSS